MSKHSNDTARERIIVNEDGADLNRDIVTREVVAPPAPARMVGPAPGEFEDTHCRDCGTLLVHPASIFVRQCLRCSSEQEERITGRRTSVELPGARRKRAA